MARDEIAHAAMARTAAAQVGSTVKLVSRSAGEDALDNVEGTRTMSLRLLFD